MDEELFGSVERAKDRNSRGFQRFTANFHLCKAFLRYFSVKNGNSFNSAKVSEKFPLDVTTAGTCLGVLEDLEIVESRTSSSTNRYMADSVDLDRLEDVEKVLRENQEIKAFSPEESS
ncbi:MAG: hypothetical protein ABEK00_03990 [Candidatus Nanohaloarchaea archaeon]